MGSGGQRSFLSQRQLRLVRPEWWVLTSPIWRNAVARWQQPHLTHFPGRREVFLSCGLRAQQPQHVSDLFGHTLRECRDQCPSYTLNHWPLSSSNRMRSTLERASVPGAASPVTRYTRLSN